MPQSAYAQSVVVLLLVAVALFASAGTVAIIGFWLYLLILAIVTAVTLTAIEPDLLRERARPGGKKPPLCIRLAGIVPLLGFVLAGLDRGRLHWSDNVPGWLQALGLILVAAGLAFFLWAMLVNRFFSSVARIQTDRNQRVISDGPYRWVRHPGYAAAFIVIPASGLALGSWTVGMLWVLAGFPFLYRRLTSEDRMLQNELPGYRDYARRVRWRVLPGVW